MQYICREEAQPTPESYPLQCAACSSVPSLLTVGRHTLLACSDPRARCLLAVWPFCSQALDEAGVEYEADWFWYAQYDPPFRLTGRHNEVWMVAKEAAPQQ